jgi:catechol 2,3-dioxygenase-like lactoylglutathione lyase family enzyme
MRRVADCSIHALVMPSDGTDSWALQGDVFTQLAGSGRSRPESRATGENPAMQNRHDAATPTRREVLALLAASAVAQVAIGQQPASLLPLQTPGLDHLDVIVPDVEKTTRFYMGLFRTTLHAQPFQGGQRYFVLLGALPANRAVGYLAIGDARGRGTYIGHFCTSVSNWQRDSAAVFAAMKEQFRNAGFGEFAGSTGFGGIFNDPDGIEIQFLPSPDTLVTAAVPSSLVPPLQGLVTPLRVDHVVVQVSDLDRAVAYYRILYGREKNRADNTANFAFANGSRLELVGTRYVYGASKPRIARFGILVEPFDRATVASGIAALGGTVLLNEGKVLRLRDADGIEIELVTK